MSAGPTGSGFGTAAGAPGIVFYGDDFTGATDTLANATRGGLRTLLFLRIPTAAQRAAAGPLDCLGIAGAARAMAPAAMRAELAPVADFFRASGARVLHYKTCSTFDSAPAIGNIAVAVAVLRQAVEQPWTAVVGGQPGLGRYCLFGHLFAAAGSGGAVFRLDRHPTMSRHPVTPMHESDLRRHLAALGLEKTALVSYTADRIDTALAEALADAPEAVLFDVDRPARLAGIGAVLRAHAAQRTLLAVGPSSVVQALAPADDSATAAPLAAADGPVLAFAGSLSPVTAQQVAQAVSYRKLWIDAAELASGRHERLAGEIATHLDGGTHLLACIRPPDAAAGHDATDGRQLARAGGALIARVLDRVPVRRLGIAGGDTSSLGVQALDAWGLSYRSEVGPGAPLCRLHSDRACLDGMEIMLKGGQMGTPDVFERLVHGTA